MAAEGETAIFLDFAWSVSYDERPIGAFFWA
jgi:hypothetical protein